MTSQTYANTIIQLSGSALINRNGTSINAREGQRLNPGDIIRTQIGTRMKVLCASGRVWDVPQGLFSGVAGGCRNNLSRLRSGDRITIMPLTRIQPNQPFNIAWTSNLESAEATVAIASDLGQVWSGTGIGTVEIPPLEPGFYTVTVTIGSAAAESSRFEVLKLDELSLIQNQIQQINNLELSDAQLKIAMANVYISAGMHYDALWLLNEAHTAESWLIAGDLFQQLGLREEAAAQYAMALSLAIANNQPDLITQVFSRLLQ